MKESITLGLGLMVVVNFFSLVKGHGRLIEPPSRATMWRYGFKTPPNYNDHELYCGGFSRQWQKNGGKCGVCGDPWDVPKPRPHEAGGKYASGTIVRRYKKDSSFIIRIELTANHKGYFQFSLCPNNAPHKVVTQSCLDSYILKQARKRDGGTYGDEPAMVDSSKFYPGNGNKVFEMRYKLPEGLTCTQCVLQWRYIAGNNWGMCSNGTGAVGCGPQEEFRACADVTIIDASGGADDTPFDNEIPDEDEPIKSDKEPTKSTEETIAWWLLLIAIIFSTFLFILISFGVIYCYFYKRDSMRKWWDSSQISIISNNSEKKKAHFWERFKDKKLPFWKTNAVGVEKDRDFRIPQPIAPPRSKREPKV